MVYWGKGCEILINQLTNQSRCPICGCKLHRFDRDGMDARSIYQCELCGDFIIDDETPMDGLYPSAMLYYRLQKKADKRTVFTKYPDAARNVGEDTVTPEALAALFPRTFSERVDKTLLTIAEIMGDLVDGEMDSSRPVTQRASWHTKGSTQGFLNLLCEIGYLRCGSPRYQLTAKGWMRVEELQRAYRNSNTVFVAMWFDNTMLGAREAIKRAVEECGYQLRIIDEKEHNNQIVPEIFYEIKQSRFVIADLTGHRSGVYYEAGFAEGIGKQVILTCRITDFQDRHFDVAQKSTIQWKDEAELQERLTKRIIATVGTAN